tara:strand:- start:11273 stop:11440 length:168 start_codon:yes stop_codon:yes gene_type:complete
MFVHLKSAGEVKVSGISSHKVMAKHRLSIQNQDIPSLRLQHGNTDEIHVNSSQVD